MLTAFASVALDMFHLLSVANVVCLSIEPVCWRIKNFISFSCLAHFFCLPLESRVQKQKKKNKRTKKAIFMRMKLIQLPKSLFNISIHASCFLSLLASFFSAYCFQLLVSIFHLQTSCSIHISSSFHLPFSVFTLTGLSFHPWLESLGLSFHLPSPQCIY